MVVWCPTGILDTENVWKKVLLIPVSWANGIIISRPLTPLSLTFVCVCVCVLPTCGISVLVPVSPLCLLPPTPQDLDGLKLVLGKATHSRSGWAQTLLSHFHFLFWYSKDFEEINRDHFTPFILWQIHIAKTRLLPKCLGCRVVRNEQRDGCRGAGASFTRQDCFYTVQ